MQTIYLEKTIYLELTKIIRIRPTVSCNIHTKFELNPIHFLEAVLFTHIQTHTHAHTHTYTTEKIA